MDLGSFRRGLLPGVKTARWFWRGRDGQYLLALMMTSKDHNNREHADRDYLDIGTGPWDAQGRPSEVKLNRVIRVHPEGMRREGAIMPQGTFKQIQDAYTRRTVRLWHSGCGCPHGSAESAVYLL